MYTLRTPIERAERLFASSEAVVCGDVRRSYAELAGRVRRVAGLLDAIAAPGDRIAVWSANSDRYVELFVGIPCAGRVIVPHNTRWAERELVDATVDAGARVLICDRPPGALAGAVERVVRLDTSEYDELLDAAPEVAPDLAPDDLAGLFYTGGTTGRSKGVMLTHANLMANAVHTQIGQPLDAGDRYLTMAPMFHAAGVYVALVVPWVGATNVVVAAFDPGRVLDLVVEEAITCAIAVPTMLAALVECQAAEPRDVSTLRWISHGASPIALEVVRRAAAVFGCELIHLYGATELSPLAAILRHEEDHLGGPRAKSCGRAAPGVEIGIVDPAGDALGTGEVGEVVVRGPNVMAGYWNRPDETAAALLPGGWYRTGDLGRLDDGGYLSLVDRAKDMIVTGGENVYCTEVEDALYAHPGVLEATVFGIPDERWGESVHAIVVPRVDELSVSELVDHCRQLIAAYKVPKSITLRTEPLPTSGPGKVLKRELRAPYWEGHSRQIN